MDGDVGGRRLGRLDAWVRGRPLVADTALAVVIAGLTLPSSTQILMGATWPVGGRVALCALVVAAHLSVCLRRVATLRAFGFVALVMLVLVLVPDVDGAAAAAAGGPVSGILLPSALVFPVMLYAAAAHASPPGPMAALAVGLVGAVVATVRMWSPQAWALPGSYHGAGLRLFLAGAFLASVLAPWALGRFRRVRSSYVDALEERAVRADQDRVRDARLAAAGERARIAREMHDVVAHSLSVIVSQAEGGRLAAGRDPAVAGGVLQTISDTGREALTEMRGLLGLLHEPGADSVSSDATPRQASISTSSSACIGGQREPGRAPRTPQPGLADLGAMVERVRASGTAVRLTEAGPPGDLGPGGELTAYRVVQEGLTNVVKHAGRGASAMVTLRWSPDALTIEVDDDGDGPTPTDHRGRGLEGMCQRLALSGGHLDTGSADGRGHRLQATLPVSSTPTPVVSTTSRRERR